MKPSFSISSVLGATALIAVLVAWWLDHRHLTTQLDTLHDTLGRSDRVLADARRELSRPGIENYDLSVKIMKLEGRMVDDEGDDDLPLEDAVEEPKSTVVP